MSGLGCRARSYRQAEHPIDNRFPAVESYEHSLVHASRMWRADRFVWLELGRSATGFCVGIGFYWLSVCFMHRVGIGAPEVQTMIWFAATNIGVAAASGRFGRWPVSDQLVAGAVVLGLGWLLVRSSTAQ